MSFSSRYAAWLIPSAIVAYSVAILPPSATPILISNLVDHINLTETQAGFIATSSIFALAVGTMLVAGLIGLVKLRTLVILASLGTIAANLASSRVEALHMLVVLQVLAGLSFGLLYGVANAALARAEKPDRAFAIAILVVKILAALMLLVLPQMEQWFGYATVFWFLAIVVMLAFPVMLQLPERGRVPDEKGGRRKLDFRSRKNWIEIEVIVITFLFFVMNGAAWSMSSQMGQRIGIPMATIGVMLGSVVTIGILGPLLASILGTRFGRHYPLFIGIGLNALAIFGVFQAQTVHLYFVLLVVFDITFLFIHPYLLGIASELDRAGKLAVTSSSLGMVGFGIAPAISGLSAQHLGMASIGWFSLIVSGTLFLMLFHVLAYTRNGAQVEEVRVSP